MCKGALEVYLYDRILALFSAVPYVATTTGSGESPSIDLTPHLTNTSLQIHNGEESVRLLEELIGCRIVSADQDQLEFKREDTVSITSQMVGILAETFKAALESPIHFQVCIVKRRKADTDLVT